MNGMNELNEGWNECESDWRSDGRESSWREAEAWCMVFEMQVENMQVWLWCLGCGREG